MQEILSFAFYECFVNFFMRFLACLGKFSAFVKGNWFHFFIFCPMKQLSYSAIFGIFMKLPCYFQCFFVFHSDLFQVSEKNSVSIFQINIEKKISLDIFHFFDVFYAILAFVHVRPIFDDFQYGNNSLISFATPVVKFNLKDANRFLYHREK